MTRVRSTDLWFNAPAIVCAYQPVAAPDPFAARQNVSNDARQTGVNTALPGVLPTWGGATGWTFNGSTQYLDTGVVPVNNQTWSMLIKFSGQSGNGKCIAFSRTGTSSKDFGFYVPAADVSFSYYSGNFLNISAAGKTVGVAGIAGNRAFWNGGIETAGNIPMGSGTATRSMYIGAMNNDGTAGLFCSVVIQSFLISSITLSPAHVAQYSLQMAYCNVKPDWSAWGRRRRYYYAPSAAGFHAAWARNANSIQQVPQ